MKRFLLIATAIALGPQAGSAQLTYMRGGQDATVGVEVARAFFDGDGPSWYTSTVRSRALFPIAESARLMVDWGVSVAGTEFSGMDATFGNPEVGIDFVDDDGDPRGSISVVLPLAFGVGDDDVSVGTGFFTDIYRVDRWADELMSVNAGVTPRTAVGDATDLTAEVTVLAVIPTGDGDTEVLSRYGLGLLHTAGAVRLRGGIEGYAILSEDDLSFGDRTLHRLIVAVDGVNGGPGFFVRVPLDDPTESIDAVAGVTFTF